MLETDRQGTVSNWGLRRANPEPAIEQALKLHARGQVHALAFPSRRVGSGWRDAQSGRNVDVFPTHWRQPRTQCRQ